MNFLNKFLISLITFQLLCLPAFCAIDIDATVDYEIRRKYNPNKIEEDLLPPLPDKLKNDVKFIVSASSKAEKAVTYILNTEE